jgi:hypothetical protein
LVVFFLSCFHNSTNPLQVGSAQAATAPRTVTIAGKRTLKPVAGVPLLRSQTAVIALKGRAQPRSTVQLAADCVLQVCTTTTPADAKGRWKAELSVVLRRTATSATVEAVYPAPASPALGDSVEVEITPPAPPVPLAPTGDPAPEFAMLGDSLAEGTAPYLPGLLPEFRVSTASRVSRPLAEGLNLFYATPLPATRRLVMAFSLFTNDHPVNIALLESAVRASVDRVGPRGCVLWATIVRRPQGSASYRPVNAMLERLGRDPALTERLEIVPWARAVRTAAAARAPQRRRPRHARGLRRARAALRRRGAALPHHVKSPASTFSSSSAAIFAPSPLRWMPSDSRTIVSCPSTGSESL